MNRVRPLQPDFFCSTVFFVFLMVVPGLSLSPKPTPERSPTTRVPEATGADGNVTGATGRSRNPASQSRFLLMLTRRTYHPAPAGNAITATGRSMSRVPRSRSHRTLTSIPMATHGNAIVATGPLTMIALP